MAKCSFDETLLTPSLISYFTQKYWCLIREVFFRYCIEAEAVSLSASVWMLKIYEDMVFAKCFSRSAPSSLYDPGLKLSGRYSVVGRVPATDACKEQAKG